MSGGPRLARKSLPDTDGGMTMAGTISRYARHLALILAMTGGAVAAPQDDYQRGLQSYQRGDVVAAMSALRPAAQAGHAGAQALLAFILDRAGFIDEALALYRSAADQDHPEGHAGLAGYFLTGRVVAKDENAALRHFSKAADLGHAASVNVLADAYLGGQMGLASQRETPAALAAVRRAADQGHLPALDALALAYEKGGLGLGPDAEQARLARERAAELRRQRGMPQPVTKPKGKS